MLRIIFGAILAWTVFFSITPAFAQDVSAGADFKSAYVLDDAIVATDDLVIQGWASVNVTDECSLDAWGSKGLGTDVGDEIDLGASCRFDVTNDTKLKVSVNRYLLLGGVPDMTALEAVVSHGPVDIGIAQYIWDGGLPDATRIQVGYNAELATRLSARAEVTYETGFGLRDTLVLGADVRYSVTDNVSVFATGYLPVYESGANGPKLLGGISFSF